jgi:hypothetical protein
MRNRRSCVFCGIKEEDERENQEERAASVMKGVGDLEL